LKSTNLSQCQTRFCHILTWNLPAFVTYLTPLKGLYFSPYMSSRLTFNPDTTYWKRTKYVRQEHYHCIQILCNALCWSNKLRIQWTANENNITKQAQARSVNKDNKMRRNCSEWYEILVFMRWNGFLNSHLIIVWWMRMIFFLIHLKQDWTIFLTFYLLFLLSKQ
jgi:hypothetical protein